MSEGLGSTGRVLGKGTGTPVEGWSFREGSVPFPRQ